MKYAIAIASFLAATPAVAQQSSAQPSDGEQRANYCIDVARQRDVLNNYAQNLQNQMNKLANELKEAQAKLKGTEDEFDAYKKKFPAPEEKKAEPAK